MMKKFSKSLFLGLAIQLFLVTALFAVEGSVDAPSTHAHEKAVHQQITITGRVTADGRGLPGVSVTVKDAPQATATNDNGSFEIEVPSREAVLVFAALGFVRQEVVVGNQTYLNVGLAHDITSLDEVVVVGYGEQRKVTLTGSVSSISNKDIVVTKNENVQNALTGRLPGLRVVQRTSQPGIFSNDFDIRGFGTPLIVIDGVPRDNIARLNSNDIESISVLKDASAAVYGVRAANGVILITTKKGQEGQLALEYSGNYGIQNPSNLPKTVGAVDWFTLVNEKTLRSAGMWNLNPPPHSQEVIDQYRSGGRQSIDWYPEVIQHAAPQTQHNLSASGSSKMVNYFLSLGYLNQDGFFKSGDLNYERYNVRSNITATISDHLTAELQLSAIADQRTQPFAGPWEVFRALWRQNPVDPMYANNNPEYLARMASGTNAIALASADLSGYQRSENKWLQGAFSLSYKFPFVEGLTAKAMASYDYRTTSDKSYQREYSLYSYTAATDTYNAHGANAPSAVRRTFAEFPASLLQGSLNYGRTFGRHDVGALLLYEEQTRQADNFYAQRELALTGLDELLGGRAENQIGFMSLNNIYHLTNKGFVGKFNYNYDAKYMAEFSFRYDGSSKFPPGQQWGFFPAASLGWRVSEEAFFEGIRSTVNELKFRGSYGMMGDDGASSYQFITGYNYPQPRGGNNEGLQGGAVFGGNFVPSVGFKNLPNPNITWFEVETMNLGVDAQLWQGLLGFQFDLFRRNREGLLATRRLSLPSSLGAPLPQENINSDQTRGFEIVLNHRHRIGDVNYNLSGNFSYTRSRWLNYDQADAVNSYNYWRRQNSSNRYNDIVWGQTVIGQFQNYDEIYNSDVYYGPNTLPGDFKYLDWNGDGVIDDNDVHPIANNMQQAINQHRAPPRMYFGFTGGLMYKNFDLNVLFQGAAMVNISYPEQLMAPLAFDGSALNYFMDRWHPVDPLANPYDPSTQWMSGRYPYTGATAAANSTFHVQDASYLRLKNLEVGYTIPVGRSAHIKNARVYVNGYNLLTFSKIKYVDPEHPSDTFGYVYPLNKTYNIGVNVSF